MNRVFVLSVSLLVCSAGSVFAQGKPSEAKLAKLGLASMEIASDEQGSEVRGTGYVAIGGRFQVSTGGVFPFGYGFFPAAFGFPWVGGTGTSNPINLVSGGLNSNRFAIVGYEQEANFTNSWSVPGGNFTSSVVGNVEIEAFAR